MSQCPAHGTNAKVQYMKADFWYSVGGTRQMIKAKDNFIVEWPWDIQNQTAGHTQVQLEVLQQEVVSYCKK